VPVLQVGGERRELLERLDKRRHLGDLRADVRLDALDLDVRVLRGRLVGGRGLLERDAELVAARPRRDLRVGVRVDVGIDPDRDRRLHAQLAGDVVDPRELGLALDVEREDARLQGQADLGVGLADARKDALLDARPRRQHAPHLPPLTKSKAEPRLAKCLTTARLEFALSE
jgi:hypothetical protein